MKLGLTEKQYKDLLTLVAEQADAPAAEPEAGTSDKQAGGQGYPEVGKWESGVTRGPANQIGVTKWADVVGAKLTRGKANMLKEQALDELPFDPKRPQAKKFKINKTKRDDFYVLDIPPTGLSNKTNIIIPKIVNGINTTASFWHHPIKNGFWSDLVNTKYNDLVPTQEMLQNVLPDGSLRSFTIGGITYTSSLERTQDKPLIISFKWFYDKNNIPYKEPTEIPNELKEKTFWQKFLTSDGGMVTELLWVAAAIIVGILTDGIVFAIIGEAGMSAEAFTLLGRRITTSTIVKYFAEAGVFGTKGIFERADGKKLSGDIDIAFGVLLPIIHELGLINRMGIGKVSKQSVDELAIKVVGKNETELMDLFGKSELEGGLTKESKDLFIKASNCSRKVWNSISKDAIKTAAETLKSKGVDIQSTLGEYLMKIGDGIQKKWLLKFPFVLMHDLILLEAVKKLLSKCGEKDRNELINLAYLNYQKSVLEGKENEFMSNIDSIVNKSNDINKTLDNAKQIFEIKYISGEPPISDELLKKMQDSVMNVK